MFLIGSGTGKADEQNQTAANNVDQGTGPPYQVKVLSADIVQIGKPLLLGVYGEFEKDIDTGLNKDPETMRQNLKLYLDGVPMAGLLAEILPAEAAVGLKKTDPKPKYVLRYVLYRNSNDDLNRKSWDSLIPQLNFGSNGLQVGVSLNGKIHLSAGPDLQFEVGDPVLITWVTWIGVGLLLVGMVAIIWSGIVRESGPRHSV